MSRQMLPAHRQLLIEHLPYELDMLKWSYALLHDLHDDQLVPWPSEKVFQVTSVGPKPLDREIADQPVLLGAARLSRPPQHSAHGALYRAVAGAVQGLLALGK